MDREKRRVCVIVIDWNTLVGQGKDDVTVRKIWIRGVRNVRGEKLVHSCKENSLVFGDTLFQHHAKNPLHMGINRE